MSEVTNLIITTSISEDPVYLKNVFSEFVANDRSFDIRSVEDEVLPQNWYGGSKKLEALIFIGAFNFLQIDDLITFLRTRVQWDSPYDVQLIIKGHNELKFHIIDLFKEE